MGRLTRERLNQIAEIYEKKSGNITETCIAANIGRRTFYRYLDNDAKFKEMIEDVNESLVDLAETKLLTLINEGDRESILFMLRTKGKDRGYGNITQNVKLSGDVKVENENSSIKKMVTEYIDLLNAQGKKLDPDEITRRIEEKTNDGK